MLHSEIIAVCSEIHTKHVNTLCRQNVELLNVKQVVHIVTAGLWRNRKIQTESSYSGLALLKVAVTKYMSYQPEMHNFV